MTRASQEINSKVQKESELQQVRYIHYSFQFGELPVEVLIDSGSEINVIRPSSAKKQAFRIC